MVDIKIPGHQLPQSTPHRRFYQQDQDHSADMRAHDSNSKKYFNESVMMAKKLKFTPLMASPARDSGKKLNQSVRIFDR